MLQHPACIHGELADARHRLQYKAGSKQRKDAPTAEPKTCDSTKVVECPLDVLMRYVYRVQDRAARLPHHAALAWVRAKDEAERTVWVDRFRNSTDTLGEEIGRAHV